MVKAYVGNLEIIANGIVHVGIDNKLSLIIENKLEMKFDFISDDKEKDLAFRSIVEDNVLIWELRNFNNPLGSGALEPLFIGTLNDKKLYVSFYVWTPDEKAGRRILNYVVYLDK